MRPLVRTLAYGGRGRSEGVLAVLWKDGPSAGRDEVEMEPSACS